MTQTIAGPMRRRRVPVTEPVPGGGRPDYADAFEIRLTEPDSRTAEQWMRQGLERAPWAVRRTVVTVHRWVLGFPLDLRPSPSRVLGWQVVSSQPDVTVLETQSRLARAVLVGRRSDPTRIVLTTFVFYRRRPLAPLVWALVGPLHRVVAPRLLAWSARGG